MRPEKLSITDEIKRQIESSGFVILVNYRGLNVGQLTELRNKLADRQARMQVVANSFLKHAAQSLGWDEGFSALIQGPTAIVTGKGDVSDVAKVLREYRQDVKLPVPTGGRLGRTNLLPGDVEKIALIPPRPELYAILVGTLASPMMSLAGVMKQKLMSLLYALKAVEDKKKAASTN